MNRGRCEDFTRTVTHMKCQYRWSNELHFLVRGNWSPKTAVVISSVSHSVEAVHVLLALNSIDPGSLVVNGLDLRYKYAVEIQDAIFAQMGASTASTLQTDKDDVIYSTNSYELIAVYM